MLTILHFLETSNSLGIPVNIDIKFNNIGTYRYLYNLSDINYDNSITKRYFLYFIQHPLIYWDLELAVENRVFKFDFITNITDSPFNKNINCINYNGIHFVKDPSMLFDRGDFLKDFNLKNGSNSFKSARGICNSLDFKFSLISELNKNNFNNGIFIKDNKTNLIKRVFKIF